MPRDHAAARPPAAPRPSGATTSHASSSGTATRVRALRAAFEARCRNGDTVRAAVLLVPDGPAGEPRLVAAWPPGGTPPRSIVEATIEVSRRAPVVHRPLDEREPAGPRLVAVRVEGGGQVRGWLAVMLEGDPARIERDAARWLSLGAATARPVSASANTTASASTNTTASASTNTTASASASTTASATATATASAGAGPAAAVAASAAAAVAPGPHTGATPVPAGPALRPAEAATPAAPAAAANGAAAADGATSEAVRTLGCQAALTGAESLDDGLRALLAVLARQHGCTRVAFGWSTRAGARVVALSDSAAGRPAHEVAAPLATAMDEALDQEATVTWPEPNGRELRISVAQAQLARLAQVGAVCSVPLVEHGRALGALTFERAGPAFDRPRTDELTRVAAFVAPVIAQRRRAERPLKTLVERLRTRLFGPRRRAGIVVVAIGLLLVAAAIVPVPDRVSGAARVEGATQRTLTAPADGWLLRVHVRPGDAVRADQVLVELDDRELSMERLRWATEADQAERQATEALARDDRAQFAVQAARGAQAKAQRGLIDAQLERQKVRAPFDGIVLSGDLTQSLGAPVRAGDTLLAVAPAGRHRVIVDVDERDIARVAADATGELALTAHAGRKVAIVVTRISPAAVARDGATVFEVEAAPRAEAELRPGYQGVAKLDADRRSVLAVLLERPWRALADRVWAWGW